ncbi:MULTISPECIES: hypothetical protein [Sinorhizobium]|jgi:hypothetical protein|uniref:hypothetical protein n=1 Tax=Sinorhizobium TaxID=28105 RepID=UPI00037B159F|nr:MULTISPECIES: hypothetical protein [Sinorhizobium]PND18721.1 hypothetical protein CN934_26480 [Ensifer sp. MMN_5]PND27788.1 hypothetical protein CN933_06625 [Sinorhizobium sp. M4_45]RVP99932.1 hypothetical protein CN070_16685 [Sinorhizobium meliloti]
MLKLVLTGVWVCAVTLGSVYFSMQHASAPVVSDTEADRRASQEYVPGEMITIPSIKDGAVQGYFLAKLSFSASREGIAKLHAPLRQLVTDELYDMLVGSKFIDVANTATFDLPGFKVAVKDGLNRKLGSEVISEVLVEQLEYLTKEDVERVANSQNRPYQKPVPILDRNGQAASDRLPESAVQATSAH